VNTFLGYLELSALGNLDGLNGLVARTLGNVLDLVYNVVALKDFSENDVAAVQPAGDDGGDKELRSVRIFSLKEDVMLEKVKCQMFGCAYRVGHAEKTLAGVLELEVLIGKLGAIDGLATGTVAFCEV
jgi:hypothetical protein